MSDSDIYYFENGSDLNELFAGHLTKNLRLVETQLEVRLTARDYWIKISGDEVNRTRACSFFEELTKIFLLRDRRLDSRDFKQALSAYSENRESELKQLYAERIKVSPRKKDVVPRTRAQLEYLRRMREKDIVFGIGPAGTGKTYLAMGMAVSELLAGNFTRIILTRPAREAGENLGFLPGNLEEKIMPYLRPLYDALYDMLEFEEASLLIEKNVIEVAPLAFMRGRTLNNAFIILDEAQNTTDDQMLMFLTRLGFDSKCVITGDPFQSDLDRRETSGLRHAAKALREIEEIAVCNFTTADVVRHALVEKIITAYEKVRS
jgi:phosphate starvation-inducible protein PhoH and related proteins